MISALLIDLDDTLIDDRGAMADAVVLFRNEHKFCPDEDDHSISTLGEVGFEEQRRMRLRTTFGLQLSDCEADSLFASYLAFYESSWRWMPGTEVFLSKTAHLPRAIVTNGKGAQARRKLERLNLSVHFQFVVTPDDCGVRKPDVQIFSHALSLLGVAPKDAMMIGDTEEADIAPAVALGMKVFHINPQIKGRSIEHAASAA